MAPKKKPPVDLPDLPLGAGVPLPPLAERLRPQTLGEVVGQENLVGPDGLLTRLVDAGVPQSLIFWGPPGSGKTTLARLYAQAFDAEFVPLSAVTAGVGEVRAAVETARMMQGQGRRTVLFLDEIHRFTRAQQDVLLPHVEGGLFVLLGATTENPSFALTSALLSRAQVVVVAALDEKQLLEILNRADAMLGGLPVSDDARAALVDMAHGDARYLLNLVETLGAAVRGKKYAKPLDASEVAALMPARAAHYDRAGDWHYDLISALHKSVRGSDPDAALYWLARMLNGGEDGLYLARRLIRMAVEDVGLADPQALTLAVAARDTFQMLGSPEGDLALAEAAIYMALAPKSNATYVAFGEAKRLAAETAHTAPPKHIVNAPTKLMKELGHGKGYDYDHNAPDAFSGQDYFPVEVSANGVGRPEWYQPVERGFEREMKKRVDYFAKLRSQRS
ncbi:MAG TPA: replication-associated recombination protein A [Alphaproteobacteria bacterium]|nr:replication-associated recombination protein A [Alphaproteobacteria bacterium]